jgi:hypothetical protein
MSNPENNSEQSVPHVSDSEWLAMTDDEKESADLDRFLIEGWKDTLADVERDYDAEKLAKDNMYIHNVASRSIIDRLRRNKA